MNDENVSSNAGPLRVGVGGPVGSGKTALLEALCKTMRDDYDALSDFDEEGGSDDRALSDQIM